MEEEVLMKAELEEVVMEKEVRRDTRRCMRRTDAGGAGGVIVGVRAQVLPGAGLGR